MPELPEVETIVRGLNKKLTGKKIISLEVLDKKIIKLSPAEIKSLPGQQIKAVRRQAKMIVIELTKKFLVIHLKMTGQLVYQTKRQIIAGGHPIAHLGKTLPNKFSRVIFKLNDGSKLYFNDVRRFGWIKLVKPSALAELDKDLGVEPLSSEFSLEKFKDILLHKSGTTIKQALMDQKYLSGLGNIYADEALFAAGVKPLRQVKTLKQEEIKKLWQAIPKILQYAIAHRGTSFSDYVDSEGEAGNFIKYLKVYSRAGKPCKRCGAVVQKAKIAGRGVHWCDFCQK